MEAAPVVATVYAVLAPDGSRRAGVCILSPRPRSDMQDNRVRCLKLYEFIDTERWALLESVLVRTSPGHIYFADSIPEMHLAALTSLSETLDITSEALAAAKFTATSDALANLTVLHGAALVGLEARPLALRAATGMISKGSLMTLQEHAGSCEVSFCDVDAYMRLDAAAVRALSLFPSARDATAVAASVVGSEHGLGGVGAGGASGAASSSSSTSAGRITCIHSLVSRSCKTKGGRNLLQQWLLQPLVSAAAIRARQALVGAFATSAQLRKSWGEGLAGVPDLDAIAVRLAKKTAALRDLARLYQFALLLPGIANRLDAYGPPAGTEGADDDVVLAQDGGDPSYDAAAGKALKEGLGGRLRWAADEFAQFVQLVEAVIEDPAAPEPRVKPSYKPELTELAAERESLEESIAEYYESVKASGGWGEDLGDDLKCERDKIRGWIFRVSRKHEKAVRGVPNVEVLSTLKDGIYFTTAGSKGLAKLSQRLEEVDAAYTAASKAVVTEAVGVARSYCPVLEAAAATVAELDAYASLGQLAASAPGSYVRPTMIDEKQIASAAHLASAAVGDEPMSAAASSEPSSTAGGAGAAYVDVRGGRHPVMELGDGVSFIANDYEMRRGDGSFQIITGPNMGGKSTYIRSLGCIAVMAQIGSYVPADAATLPVFDCICARVGAGDRAIHGVSTFMAEMLEASSILATATPQSLVIVDELGRGTSTYDGFGLAWAISEHLAQQCRSFTLFATHFHELTALASTTRAVKNRHVTALTGGDDGVTMLYAVRDGACPSSFGIHVAAMAGFPAHVVDTARRKAAQLESTSGGAAAILERRLRGTATGADGGPTTDDLAGVDLHAALGFVEALTNDPVFETLSPADQHRRIAELISAASTTTERRVAGHIEGTRAACEDQVMA